MIVEFIGASGAGKTTLARSLASRFGDRYLMQSNLITDVTGLGRFNNPHLVNVVADMRAIRPFRQTLRENRHFVAYAFEMLRRNAPTRFSRYNYMRNVIRKLGVYQLSLEQGNEVAVLADEGTLLTAYQLFVYSMSDFDRSDVDEFTSLVPLPDHVVYVRTPLDLLVRRAKERPDPRRELYNEGDDVIEETFEKAVRLFDNMATTPPLRDRTLVIESGEVGVHEATALIDARLFIEERAPGGRSSGREEHRGNTTT